MTGNPPAMIENREQLIELLSEAAEIEHNLMCCYLYGAFSLKDSLDEGITAEELAAIRRWRREILHVAIDEMAHLALVANISSAIGGLPHLERPNFPIASGYHPAGIVVKLAPFNADTLRHFIYLERPEHSAVGDGAGFDPPRRYVRTYIPGRLMPTACDYETVGALYRCIQESLEELVALRGEPAVFVGDPAHQIGPELANLPGLTRVRCLRTAREAIHGIVTQGEGASEAESESHYQRFLRIQTELEALQAARPDFVPGRPAAHNPVMRRPPVPEGKLWVELQPAADLLDLVNAAYNLMLRLLAQAYGEHRGVDYQRAEVDAAVDLMFAITPLASALTKLPASDLAADCTAGMSFAMNRLLAALPANTTADRILLERCEEIVAAAEHVLPRVPGLENAIPQFRKLKTRLEAGLQMNKQPASVPVAKPTSQPIVAGRSPPPSTIVDGVERVEGTALVLNFEGKRCIHARHCVLGLPKVFKANVEGPWIDPDATTVEALVTVAHMCPSGAIRYERKDGGAEETAPAVNLMQLRENGPLGMRGDLRIDGQAIGFRATLCRCGASQRKPFCDGSHNTVGFIASGEPATRTSEPLTVRDGPIDIRPQRNGPLVIRGNLEICAGTGRTVDRVTEARLCRCGGSKNKPFCDGSHTLNGFEAE